MAVPQWSESQLLAPTKVGTSSAQRVTFNISSAFQAVLFLRASRLTSGAPASGLIMQVNRIPWNVSTSGRVNMPQPIAVLQDNTSSGGNNPVSASNTVLSQYPSIVVNNATNANPIVITTTSSHGFSTNDIVMLANVGGNTNANGTWQITVTGTNTFSLNGASGNSNYTSGGTVQLVNGVTTTSNTGLAAGVTQQSMVGLVNSTSNPTIVEFHRVAKVTSGSIFFAEPLSNVPTTGWAVLPQALVSGPIAVTGGASGPASVSNNPVNFEVIFDNQNETTQSYVVEAWLQQMTSIQ